MRKTLFAILLALALVLIPVGSAFAATTADVDVTATPSILSITVVDKGGTPTPANWVVNDVGEVTGQRIVRNTDYYSNPVDDETAPSNPVLAGECHFTLDNDGDVTADIDINMTDLGAMTIIAGGYTVNDADSFGASAYIEGLAWPGAVVNLFTADTLFLDDFAPGDIDFGVALLTQSGSFTVPGDLTGNINLTAEES